MASESREDWVNELQEIAEKIHHLSFELLEEKYQKEVSGIKGELIKAHERLGHVITKF